MATQRKSEARKHHYLSQCYLKGFTKYGTKDSQLITLNLDKRIFFSTVPEKVGAERDFNTIDLNGFEPGYLESELSTIEDDVADAIRNVENTGKFSGDDKVYILNLMALFAVRNPTRRKWWNGVIDEVSKVALSMAASNVGGTSNGFLITEDVKKFIDEGKFKIEASRNDHINLELRVLDDVIRWLLCRKWILLQAPNDAEFVTCDCPIALIWVNPNNKKHSPGFKLPGTEVHFALSKKFALVGTFDDVEDEFASITKDEVALINSNILLQARHWVHASSKDFYFLNPKGNVLFGEDKFWNEFNPKSHQ